ncbi:MAG: nitroreductase family protein [Desulfovibrionaceae bacterium]|jgi:nitroreductase|nr:nitroreductase family protein [Desulfovibrionaceae bacterium]
MEFKELVARNRSYRRFKESEAVSMATLEELVGLARLTGSAGNLQPLKYALVAESAANAEVFGCLAWAAYLKDWPGPAEGERPTAYVVILHDTSVAASAHCDHGIVAQTMLLGAVEKGLGGCILASVNRKRLAEVLQLPEGMEILLVLALGVPAETVVIDEPEDGGLLQNHKYWRDDKDVHHVPKRTVAELIALKRG